MYTWHHKDSWTMKGKSFEVKITRSDLDNANSWRIFALIYGEHPLFKRSYDEIYQVLPFPKGYYDGNLITEDRTYKKVEVFYIGKKYSDSDCKRDVPKIFNNGEEIYNELERLEEITKKEKQ